jgi:hypothetical protein
MSFAAPILPRQLLAALLHALVPRAVRGPDLLLLARFHQALVLLAERPVHGGRPPLCAPLDDADVVRAVTPAPPLLVALGGLAAVRAAVRGHDARLADVAEVAAARVLAPPVPVAEPLGDAALCDLGRYPGPAVLVFAGVNRAVVALVDLFVAAAFPLAAVCRAILTVLAAPTDPFVRAVFMKAVVCLTRGGQPSPRRLVQGC